MNLLVSPAGADPTDPARRLWLKRSSALMAASLGTGSVANLLLGAGTAHAADYKALVCVFLYGGNDGNNMLVPTDAGRYQQYAEARGGLALPQQALLPMAGSDYGLHPSLAALAPLWDAGALVPVFNVGPLRQPLTKKQYLKAAAGSPTIPDSLFSHSHQQILWESSSSVSQASTGWGGRALELMNAASPVLSFAATGRFGVGPLRNPLQLPAPGDSFAAIDLRQQDLTFARNQLRKDAIDAMYAEASGMALRDAQVAQQNLAFEMSERLNPLILVTPQTPPGTAIDLAFEPLWDRDAFANPLAAQLYQVAKMIESRAVVQGDRHIYFTALEGFDTHNDQVAGSETAVTHAYLLQQVGDAMAAFQAAITALGLAPSVTTFTQSDFGRTLAPNSTGGSDHGWGNHQLVMGGALNGGQTYGSFPRLVLGGPDDVGNTASQRQGRWIPTSAVDQYAATLLRWMGADDAQLDATLPNLVNFGARRSLGFL